MWVVDTTVGINVLGGGSLVWCIRVVGVFGSEQIHFVRGTVVVCRFGREQLRFVRGTVVVCRFGREQFWFVRGPVCTFALQFSASFTVAS
jgi:hypothetical protein